MNAHHMTVHLNGVAYAWPDDPVVVVCIDGGDPQYIASGRGRGLLPNIERFMSGGFHALAQGAMPSFTCPNNMSIATGAPPSVHGVSGNFHLDRATGEPTAMTGPAMLRSRSVLAEFARQGATVVSVTAKDKLRAQLSKDLPIGDGRAVSFSAQCADQCSLAENGVENVLALLGQPLPGMYSTSLSLFVLDAGIHLLRAMRPELMYLSLTDFVQHAYPPGHPLADEFYVALDARLGALAAAGAVVALTADHGMSDMADAQGAPRVIWLQQELDQAFGARAATVICPITDAFVGHHGSLGGFVRVYVRRGTPVEPMCEFLREIPGVARVWMRNDAVRELELPWDVEADIAVMAQQGIALGTRPECHDLAGLCGQRLRSHGSIWEAQVPFIVSRPLNDPYARRAAEQPLRSRDLFDFALNGVC